MSGVMSGTEAMNGKWSAIPPARRDAMRRRFTVLFAADLLAEPDAPPAPPETGTRPLRFDELYEAATNPSVPLTGRVAGALEADPDLRAEFEALLEAHAVCWFPVAAAAAGEEGLGRREADGFRIHVRPSAAGAGQVYVLIRVEDGDAKPAALVALPPDGPSLRVPLPEAIEGVYQLIEQEDSALVRAIRDPASKLALQWLSGGRLRTGRR